MFRMFLVAGLSFSLATPALALECPTPSQIDDASTAATVAKILPPGIDLTAPEAVQSAIFDLKQAGVSQDIIIDNLIASYCSNLAAEAGMSDADKSQKLEDFSTMTVPLVFGGTN